MPRTKSSKRALRKSTKQRVVNVSKKRSLKSIIKKYENMISSHDLEGAMKYLPTVYKALDKSAKTDLIKKNKSSRLKSRLTKKISKSK